MNQILERKAVRLKEAAKILGVSTDTVRRAIKNGKMKAFQFRKNGNYHITLQELEKFMQG